MERNIDQGEIEFDDRVNSVNRIDSIFQTCILKDMHYKNYL